MAPPFKVPPVGGAAHDHEQNGEKMVLLEPVLALWWPVSVPGILVEGGHDESKKLDLHHRLQSPGEAIADGTPTDGLASATGRG